LIAARLLAMSAVVAASASLALACEQGSTAAATAERGGNCATCHMPEYQHAADPVHVDAKPTTCGVCHVEDAWRPSVVHHEWWALTGAHQKPECSWCHGHKGAPDVFKGTPKECIGCHRPEFDSSTYPGHASFPTKCADCHTTTSFRPATFKPPPVVVTPKRDHHLIVRERFAVEQQHEPVRIVVAAFLKPLQRSRTGRNEAA